MIDLSKIPAAFVEAHDLPRPQWKVLHELIPADASLAQRHALWCEIQRQWLTRLRDALSEPYQLMESDHLFILTAYRGDANWMIEYAERAYSAIDDLVHDVLPKDRFGKLVILIFGGEARFWQYVRYYHPATSTREAAGVFIRDGDAHIAIATMQKFRMIAAHEMAHAVVSHLKLPTWVDEGIAQRISRQITRRGISDAAPDIDRHRDYWKTHGVQGFWSGTSFKCSDDRTRLMVYELSELLVDAMAALDRKTFKAFLGEAGRADAGDGACRKHYGLGLEVWMKQVLGPGLRWAPQPALWENIA